MDNGSKKMRHTQYVYSHGLTNIVINKKISLKYWCFIAGEVN